MTSTTPRHTSDAISAPHLEALRAAGFEVERTVAAGRFGVVYRAFDATNQREVAIKLIDADGMRPALGAHSEREIRVLASLNHPHVVPLFSSGQLDARVHYLVMPWLEGETLRARLRAHGRLSITDALRVGVGIADALVALHSHGLVHRDVKPDNVLFDGRHAVLVDFGLVCAVRNAPAPSIDATAASATELTPEHTVMGTPAYMAPEQWYRDAPLDGRADVFGLGALLYEILTGVAPNDEVPMTRRVRSTWRWSDTQPTEDDASPYRTPIRPVVSLRDRRGDAPAALERLLRQALRLDPEVRLATAAEFRDRLECLLAEQLAASSPFRWLRTRP